MSPLIGKVLKQNERAAWGARLETVASWARRTTCDSGAGETANGTELQFRDSFSVFGRGHGIWRGKNTKVPWNRSLSSTLSPQ
jgi:hypothetical protein